MGVKLYFMLFSIIMTFEKINLSAKTKMKWPKSGQFSQFKGGLYVVPHFLPLCPPFLKKGLATLLKLLSLSMLYSGVCFSSFPISFFIVFFLPREIYDHEQVFKECKA